MVAKKEFPPELLAEAKRLYELTLTPVDQIMAMLGVARSLFYRRVKEWGWRRRKAANGTFELVRSLNVDDFAIPRVDLTSTGQLPAAVASAAPVTPERRQALAERIQSVVEREMTLIEMIVKKLKPSDQAEAERSMRTLATISRTLREIRAINQPDGATPPDEADDDSTRDIDEFRLELARRIHALIDARQAGASESSGATAGGADQRPT